MITWKVYNSNFNLYKDNNLSTLLFKKHLIIIFLHRLLFRSDMEYTIAILSLAKFIFTDMVFNIMIMIISFECRPFAKEKFYF